MEEELETTMEVAAVKEQGDLHNLEIAIQHCCVTWATRYDHSGYSFMVTIPGLTAEKIIKLGSDCVVAGLKIKNKGEKDGKQQ